MINFILIWLCIITGFALKRLNVLPEGAHRSINIWILYMAVPAVSLKYIPGIQWSANLLLPAAMPVIVWTGAWLLFKLISLKWQITPATRAALILTAGLGNTSFLGFPLIMGYYGEHALPIAVIADQVSFVIMSTFGAVMAMSASTGERVPIVLIVKRVFQFPPFLAFVAAIVLPHFIDLSPISPLFDRIAATLVPLALFSVGMQLSFNGWREELPYLTIGIGYKLIIAPLLILLLIIVLHLKGIIPQISLFEAAMAPMITAGVIATQYNLNPKLASLMVGIGILLSFITTALWWWVLQGFA